MFIIRINGIFYIITPSYMFRLSLFEPSSGWSIIYLKRVIHTIYNIVVDCEISIYIYKIF